MTINLNRKKLEQFYAERAGDGHFVHVLRKASDEVLNEMKERRLPVASGSISLQQWASLDDASKLQQIVEMGLHGISRTASYINVDFAKMIPNSLAMTLLFLAYNGTAPVQIIDAGDDQDNKDDFIQALRLLSKSYSGWDCKIVNPVKADICSPQGAASREAGSANEDAGLRELKKYVHKRRVPKPVIWVGIAYAAYLIIQAIIHGSYSAALLLGIAVLIIYIMSKVSRDHEEAAIKEIIGKAESQNAVSEMVWDFQTGARFFGDKLRAGEHYIVCNGTGLIIPYGDIKRFFVTVHKTNFIETGRSLCIINTEGHEQTICPPQKRYANNGFDEEVRRIATIMLMHNPRIAIGYPK